MKEYNGERLAALGVVVVGSTTASELSASSRSKDGLYEITG